LPPKAGAFAVDPGTFSGDADVLAREAARYHVNNSAPGSAVKGANVIPYREGREKAVILSLGKNARGVGLALNSADSSPPEQVSAEYSAASACEKSQLIHSPPDPADGVEQPAATLHQITAVRVAERWDSALVDGFRNFVFGQPGQSRKGGRRDGLIPAFRIIKADVTVSGHGYSSRFV
jgi:hypothetical protein